MIFTNAEQYLSAITADAGVSMTGGNPWDITINDPAIFNQVLASGRLALGEGFVNGQWDCERIDQCIERLFNGGAVEKLTSLSTVWLACKARLLNLQSSRRAFEVGEQHYDYGNDMYQAMLGPTMVYTSGIRLSPDDTLEDMQRNKMRAICEKLGIQPGDRVLDIGCGWGGFMKFAAQEYGAECVGLSVSVEQTQFGREFCKGLPIEFVVTDYRDYYPERVFDHVVSVEMFEHVGPKNHRAFFQKVHDVLKPGGRKFIQVLGDPNPKPRADPWIDKYIFPNGILPSLPQLERSTRDLFHWDDMEDIGLSYDHTLMAWWRNLEAVYPELHRAHPAKYNTRFLRMFKYYLQICAAIARTRNMYDWQIVMTKR